MNLKMDWVDVAVQTLRSLLVGRDAGFGLEDIDKLLANYASKALDFSCAPRERSRSGQCTLFGNSHRNMQANVYLGHTLC